LTRRLNLQLNGDTANSTRFIQKYDVRLIRIGFFQQCLCSAVSTSACVGAIKV
jgi:hypothetical protein